ncbi:hypothetical protein LUZ61_008504 [Rhynchospora tenuis]|uniref:Uncharacterized protein n=1 Tax=Rhynchospora tenuis TaxID=198213 RepID=A0AAD6EXL2_9POAL|nr:hypothetical protein LUZ61_008504 [Rhynchospora tenuis]
MFEPSVISIGPYHRGRPHLRAMEEKKWSILQDFLTREGRALQDCISVIKEAEKRARCCYSEPFAMSSDDFVEMMVLDGCFILEFFCRSFVTNDLEAIKEGWNSWFIETDLMLLDNQIPYFIIEILLGYPLNNPELLMLIASTLTRKKMSIKALSGPQKIHHLLHLCLCYAVPSVSTQHAASEPNHCPFLNWIRAVPVLKYFSCSKKEEDLELDNEMGIWEIPCVTELEEAGVKFKKLEQSDDITKITFQSGTLFIPCLRISDSRRSLFMNLVAMEQCMFDQLPCYFSTYMVFLVYLVSTARDVRILQQKGILQSMLSSEEEVALFFNQIGLGVMIPHNHYLAELFKRVNKYRESRYHRYRAKLSRDYFNNPWSIVTLIAATLLLCLTIIQSFMSVYAYIRPPPSSPS